MKEKYQVHMKYLVHMCTNSLRVESALDYVWTSIFFGSFVQSMKQYFWTPRIMATKICGCQLVILGH
jgi:hypothetical protein